MKMCSLTSQREEAGIFEKNSFKGKACSARQLTEEWVEFREGKLRPQGRTEGQREAVATSGPAGTQGPQEAIGAWQEPQHRGGCLAGTAIPRDAEASPQGGSEDRGPSDIIPSASASQKKPRVKVAGDPALGPQPPGARSRAAWPGERVEGKWTGSLGYRHPCGEQGRSTAACLPHPRGP